MSSKNFSLAALLPLMLSACASTPGAPAAEPALAPPSAGRSNAAPAQFAVGRNADAALENEARIRAGAKTARALKPNQMVTMEFNAERLNLSVDDSGKVTRVSCG